MIAATTFAGKRVALFGLGGSGLATARALREGGAEVAVWDDNASARGFSPSNLPAIVAMACPLASTTLLLSQALARFTLAFG